MSFRLPQGLLDEVRAAGRAQPGGVAAFDADGTLWREDVGEAFLQHLCRKRWIALPGGGDPYAEYLARVARDRPSGFAYAAQLQAGLVEAAVQGEAERFARSWIGPRLVSATQALLEECLAAGLVPAVVSASPVQIIRAAGPLASLPGERCLGMTTLRDGQGRLTDEIVPPLVYAEGKVAALRKAGLLCSAGALALACGDSLAGDLALLESARVPVVVAPASGSPLGSAARKRGWAVLPCES